MPLHNPPEGIIYSGSEQLMADVRITEIETLVTLTQRVKQLENALGITGIGLTPLTGRSGPV